MSWKLTVSSVPLPVDVLPSTPDAEADRKTATINHLFDDAERNAINAALAAGRPLLVRGEPGVGKSQLARAAAIALNREFKPKVIDVRTEPQDLLWEFDAVRRLADAQVLAHDLREGETVRDRLAERRYILPGPLWWGFDWTNAKKQAARYHGEDPDTIEDGLAPNGVVVLIDEIDKADSSVPNGLLEALGQQKFTTLTGEEIVCEGRPPLIVVTTNEERTLPDAFLRRCLVLQLNVPTDPEKQRRWLLDRGRAHFDEAEADDDLLKEAARLLMEDRAEIAARGLAPPGGAEYLDLLRAVVHLEDDMAARKNLLETVGKFTLKKHPGPAFPGQELDE